MKTFSNIISVIFQPIFIPLMGIILLMQTEVYNLNFPIKSRLIIYAGVFLLTGVIPAFTVLFGMLLGKISDGFISHRKQRTIPYLVSMVSYVFCNFFLIRQGMGLWVSLLMAGATISLILIFIINFFWKISAHMAGIGGLCGGTFACALGLHINPVALMCILILISGAVAYSRIYLKAHTSQQVLMGYLLGFFCVFSPYIYVYTLA